MLVVPFGLVPVTLPMTVSNSAVPELPAERGKVAVTVVDLPGARLTAEVKEVAGVKSGSLRGRKSTSSPRLGITLVAAISPLLVTTMVTT